MSTSTAKIWNDPRAQSTSYSFQDHGSHAEKKLHIHLREDSSTSGNLCCVFLFADFGVIGDGTFTYFIKHNQKKLYGDEIPLNQNIPQEALDQLKK